MSDDIPDGYKLRQGDGRYVHDLGPWCYRVDPNKGGERGQIVLAIRVDERHCNIHDIAHGGFLVTMLDTALGIVISSSREPPQPVVTVSLATNFLGSLELGDWVEAHVDVDRMGGRLVYASCRLVCSDRLIMTGTAVFAMMKPAVP